MFVAGMPGLTSTGGYFLPSSSPSFYGVLLAGHRGGQTRTPNQSQSPYVAITQAFMTCEIVDLPSSESIPIEDCFALGRHMHGPLRVLLAAVRNLAV
jgi:hypothetical protein